MEWRLLEKQGGVIMAYYSCSMIEQMYLTFSGRIDEDGSAISLCCESDEEIPKVPFAGTPEETLRSIVDKWNLVLTESKKYAITPPPRIQGALFRIVLDARFIGKQNGSLMA